MSDENTAPENQNTVADGAEHNQRKETVEKTETHEVEETTDAPAEDDSDSDGDDDSDE